jgi:hypothetical protein
MRSPAVCAMGLALASIGIAHHMAFFSAVGLIFVVSGLALLALAATALPEDRGGGFAYPLLLVFMCALSALAPFDPAGINTVELTLTLAALVAFYALGVLPPLRGSRLPVAGLLIVAAHAHFLLRFPSPQHEDVWHFLNGGVDLLLRGQNPYLGVPIIEVGVAKVLTFTYPPGALLELAPFRLLLGDVRWAYIAAEIVVVGLWWLALRRLGAAQRWREALVLVPLVLPRTSQAFYIFTNHEWVLLALTMVALTLAWRSRWTWCALALGLGMASKQYFIVFPVLFMLPALRRRVAALGVGVAVVICLPFLLWSPTRFLSSVLGNLALPPDPDRLTLWATFHQFGVVLPSAVASLIAALALAAVLWLAYRGRGSLSESLVACGIGLALFSLCSTFSAYNYFAYALVFVTWGLLLAGVELPVPVQRPAQGAADTTIRPLAAER